MANRARRSRWLAAPIATMPGLALVAAFVVTLVCLAATPAGRAATPLAETPDALASAMLGRRIVVLGEVHDNGAQHALRLGALRALLDHGARPAIAFEQFDRERQDAIERARRERPRDADHVITQAQGAPSWRWEFYRPFVALALEYDLPIVAANLSRADAMKLAQKGEPSSPAEPHDLPEGFVRAHEASIAEGHCNLLPPEALPGMARAQIARDRTLAEAIRPFARRGVVLLTGNGHGRIDIGMPYWLTKEERLASVSIGVLERVDDQATPGAALQFDAYVLTERAKRPDPCEDLRKRMRPPSVP